MAWHGTAMPTKHIAVTRLEDTTVLAGLHLSIRRHHLLPTPFGREEQGRGR